MFQGMITPLISLTPLAVAPKSAAALLSAPPQAVALENNVITFVEGKLVAEDADTITFDLCFVVQLGEQKVDLVRRVIINRGTFVAEARNALEGVKTFYVEAEKPGESELARSLRELAGIPHKRNFV